jgi:hypothetical protein
MQYTETELEKLIKTVEQEFTISLNKTEEAVLLAKAEGSAPPKEKKESKPAEKKSAPPKKEGAAPAEEAAPAEGEEAAPAEGEEAAPAEGEGNPLAAEGEEAVPAEGAAPAGAPAAGGVYDAEDLAHMQKMYASMSREELMAHHDAVRQALDAMGAQEQQAPGMGAEQAPGAAPAAGAPVDKCGDMTMGKSEIEDENPVLNSKAKPQGSETNTAYNKNSGGKISGTGEPHGSPGAKSPASKVQGVQMSKSEGSTEVELLKSELEAEKATSAELKKSFDKATELLTNFVKKVSVPQGKAITEIGTLAKSEVVGGEVSELSKAEVTDILNKKDYTKLTKSDRDAINSYYLDGSNFNTISHLLKN